MVGEVTVTEARGTREVAEPRERVWRALAVLRPYCAVCDVSYVVTGSGAGATFVCVPGRIPDGDGPGDRAPTTATRGEIVEWVPHRLVATRLDRADESWTTRLELTGTDSGGTRVTVALRREAREGSRVVRAVQRRAVQRLVRRTLDTELAALPAHIAQVAD